MMKEILVLQKSPERTEKSVTVEELSELRVFS